MNPGAAETLYHLTVEGRRGGLQKAPLFDMGRHGMKDSELKASLERAEAAYEDLLRTRRSLGTMLAQAIKKEGGLPEFKRRREDLPLLLRSADIRRTKLKVELLERRLQTAQEEHRGRAERVRRAGAALEEARKALAQAVNVEQRLSLEVRRLEALHREELGRLERLLMEEAERKKEEEEVATP
jgi:hypothetical protein